DMTAVKQIDPAELAAARARSISENIEESGVVVQNLNVSVEGDKAILRGKVNTQSCCEKLTLVAGNQHGIACVDCQLEVANPEPEAKFYTVKSGDTLGKIAKEFYGDAGKYPVIFEANQPMLADPDKIYVGQNLRIPAA
ncbi:MAG: peptidoglycan-binding protein LysM, partial [Pseudomonadales bacterium]|nr:peptidoglycan-binding protein LysM [Pseudomonadales bacterium]